MATASTTDAAISTDAITAAAKKTFAALKQQWIPKSKGGGGFDTYWKLGNSFDTIIDYFAHIDASEAKPFVDIAKTAYGGSTGNACWYDDYGWWGIASLKAEQRPDLFGTVDWFKQIREHCWEMMHDNATNVWKNNKTNPDFKILEPRHAGGVWNRDWSHPDGCGEPGKPPHAPAMGKPAGKQGANLGGIQNMVTNGLYLILALRLSEATNGAAFKAAAKAEYDFLTNWLEEKGLLSLRLDLSSPNSFLARERMPSYFTGTQAFVYGYEPDLAWAGDQGLLTGGMVDWMIVNGTDNTTSSKAFKDAAGILHGVEERTLARSDKIVQPWINGAGGDPSDYATGVGVFMRYLLYADQKNRNLRPTTRSIGYQRVLVANVKQVLSQPVGTDFVTLTNNLAVLVTGFVMLS